MNQEKFTKIDNFVQWSPFRRWDEGKKKTVVGVGDQPVLSDPWVVQVKQNNIFVVELDIAWWDVMSFLLIEHAVLNCTFAPVVCAWKSARGSMLLPLAEHIFAKHKH